MIARFTRRVSVERNDRIALAEGLDEERAVVAAIDNKGRERLQLDLLDLELIVQTNRRLERAELRVQLDQPQHERISRSAGVLFARALEQENGLHLGSGGRSGLHLGADEALAGEERDVMSARLSPRRGQLQLVVP